MILANLLSGVNPIIAVGTQKRQGAIGKFSASLYFIRKKQANYYLLTVCFIYTIVGSIIGTIILQNTLLHEFEKLVPFLLLAVLLYYIFNLRHKPYYTSEIFIPNNKKFLFLGTTIGFYNGFFGPGTGSIWAMALMRFFKIDIKMATIYAKPLNLVGNLTALSIFIMGGRVNFIMALTVGIGSLLGGRLGASLVIYKNSRW